MTNTKPDQKPPAHLRPKTKQWWRRIVAEFEFEERHLRLLQLACEAFDRSQEARAVLAKEGLTYRDRFGAPRLNPAATVERDSRLSFAKLLRELNITDTAAPDAARPNR